MKLTDLVKPLGEMTSEELQSYLREIRHRRETVRPAAQKIVERAEVKTERKKTARVQDLLTDLTPEEKLKLVQQLLADGGESNE